MLEVFLRVGIRAQGLAIAFVGGEAVELDQRKGEVVGSFLGQEVAQQRAATARDDRRPGLRVTLEVRDAVGIERIADSAGDHVTVADTACARA
jgi:hypothetical protein